MPESESEIEYIPARNKQRIYQNPRGDEIQVGYYFLGDLLEKYDKHVKSRSDWMGWLGSLTACAAGIQSTVTQLSLENYPWLMIWMGGAAISATLMVQGLKMKFDSGKYNKEWVLSQASGSDIPPTQSLPAQPNQLSTGQQPAALPSPGQESSQSPEQNGAQ